MFALSNCCRDPSWVDHLFLQVLPVKDEPFPGIFTEAWSLAQTVWISTLDVPSYAKVMSSAGSTIAFGFHMAFHDSPRTPAKTGDIDVYNLCVYTVYIYI